MSVATGDVLWRPPGPGSHRVRLRTDLPTCAVVEVRAETARAAFHGEFALQGVQVTASGPGRSHGGVAT